MNIKEFRNREWYIQRFSGRPYTIFFGGIAATQGLAKFYGISYGHMIFITRSKGAAEAYFDSQALQNLGEFIITKYKKNNSFISNVTKKSRAYYITLEKTIKNKDLSKLSLDELCSLYQKLQLFYLNYWSHAHLIEGFTTTTDITIKNMLKEQLDQNDLSSKFTEYFELFTTQTKKSFMNDEYTHLLQIKQKMIQEHLNLDSKPILKLIQLHQQKYFWMGNSYHSAQMLGVDYFKEQLKNMNQTVVGKKERNFDQIKQAKRKLIRELKLSPKLMLLLDITEQMTNWQDLRKKDTLLMIHYFELVLREISQRVRIDLENLRWLEPSEINEAFLAKLDNQLVEERKKGTGYFHSNQGLLILNHRALRNFTTSLEKTEQEVQELSGLTGSLGRAVGKVKVCMSASHLNKLEEGDILVTSMTRPEFLLGMKKAAGVITDEGGITCHAAIVCRELKIPCLIGTKNATKILKDGYLVELKANHGRVKILER